MSNVFGGYLPIYWVFEDMLSYNHLGSIFWGPYDIIAIILVLSILEQAMNGWLGEIHLGGHHSIFFKVCAIIIEDVVEGVNLEV